MRKTTDLLTRSSIAVVATTALLASSCGESARTIDASIEDRLCAKEARATAYRSGLERGDAELRVRFVDARPSPPDKGSNAWTVAIADDHGAIAATSIVSLRPWMPDHGHGSIPSTISLRPKASVWETGPFDLFMRGYWTFAFEVATSSTSKRTVEFAFCLEGLARPQLRGDVKSCHHGRGIVFGFAFLRASPAPSRTPQRF